MQNLMKISLISLLSICAFASCTKHNSEKSTSAQFFSASSSTIGSFSSSGSSLYAAGAGGAKFWIRAMSTMGAEMDLWLDPFPGTTGVYSIDGISCGAQYSNAGSDTVISSAHGSMTITAVTPDLIGSFVYTGRDSVIYTGSFNVVLVP